MRIDMLACHAEAHARASAMAETALTYTKLCAQMVMAGQMVARDSRMPAPQNQDQKRPDETSRRKSTFPPAGRMDDWRTLDGLEPPSARREAGPLSTEVQVPTLTQGAESASPSGE